MPDVKCVLIHDNFQNFKSYNIPKAQLVIADIPYNIGTDFYASRPDWYVDGDNKNGESSKARKAAFNTDFTFNIAEYFHFCNRLLKKEPGTGEKDAPCMIVFCAFQQTVGLSLVPFCFKHNFRQGGWLGQISISSPTSLTLLLSSRSVASVDHPRKNKTTV